MSEAFDLTLSQASRLVPGHPHATSIWRWCRKGILARNGQRVHLEHRRFGGRIFTSAQALERFSERLVDADREHFAARSTRDPAPAQRERTQGIEAAHRGLREMGFE